MYINVNTQTFSKFDLFADKIPVVSSVTNIINLFLKCVIFPFISKETIIKNHYFSHIKEKRNLSCVCLLIPIFGNIINWMIARRFRKQGEDLFNQYLGHIQNDQALAFTKLHEAAKLQNSDAQTTLGFFYLNGGYGLSKDEAKGFELTLQAAKQKDPKALYNLYLCYYRGQGTPIDNSEARKSLTESANLNCPEAKDDLGFFYLSGSLGFDKDEYKGFELIKEAAQSSIPKALYNLFVCYSVGQGTSVDYSKAKKSLIESANLHYYKAETKLGLFYLNGEFGFDKDVNKGFELLKKASIQKCPTALYHLYICYRRGEGTVVDDSKARECLIESAKLNFAQALSELGNYHLNGTFGFDKDVNKAFQLIKRAAEQNSPIALYNLYLCYRFGKETAVDEPKARECLIKSAKLNFRDALCNLGICYLNGTFGFDKNVNKAFLLIKEAVKQKCPTSLYNLFDCYRLGNGTEINGPEARKCLIESANLNFREAKSTLGVFYLSGELDFVKDVNKGFKLIKEAAKQNCPVASYNLFICYRFGLGTTINEAKARKWLEISAKSLNPRAAIELTRIQEEERIAAANAH